MIVSHTLIHWRYNGLIRRHTSAEYVREEREAEEDDREDEVAKATDGVGPITADYEWKEVGV